MPLAVCLLYGVIAVAGSALPGPAPAKPAVGYTELSPLRSLLNGDADTEWLNFGLWQGTPLRARYADAAAALADAVSRAAGVVAGDVVLEAGGGRGDNALRLLQRFAASRVYGMNYSPEETRAAQSRLRSAGLSDRAVLQQGDAARDLVALALPAAVQRVVAVDCAYHFATRRAFLRSAASALEAGGGLALADVVVDTEALDPLRSAALPTVGWLFGIPEENLVSAAGLEEDLAAAGFSDIQVDDVTERVFPGFADHMQDRAATVGGSQGLAALVVSAVMTLLARSGFFRYIIASGIRRRT